MSLIAEIFSRARAGGALYSAFFPSHYPTYKKGRKVVW